MTMNETLEIHPHFDRTHADHLYDNFWRDLEAAQVVDLQRLRHDLLTWRRGSAQMALKINPALNNVSIYSVLVSDVQPNEALYLHLLSYNNLQRRESLGLLQRHGRWFVILKYTMELEIVTSEVLRRHVYHLQEMADQLDTELVERFGGRLHFEDWKRLDQDEVDSLLDDLFG